MDKFEKAYLKIIKEDGASKVLESAKTFGDDNQSFKVDADPKFGKIRILFSHKPNHIFGEEAVGRELTDEVAEKFLEKLEILTTSLKEAIAYKKKLIENGAKNENE